MKHDTNTELGIIVFKFVLKQNKSNTYLPMEK